MKFTWGTGIAIFFSLFVAFMLFMVYQTSQQDFDLVTEDYYSAELAYQDVIDRTENYLKLGEEVRLEKAGEALRIVIPENALDDQSKTQLHLFRPSDDLMDKVYEFSGSNNLIEIPAADLIKGKYLIKLAWTTGEVPYYFESEYYY